MFDGTIADNIRWGRPDATRRRSRVAAARAADVARLRRGPARRYETRVGQRGRLLSGGQRQRLAIARAMIRDAPVLLLDEPTTGLDAESAERVLAPLRRLMAGRTTLIISHNLLTVTDADQILYLEDGRITAVGAHAELLTRSPGYARLYRLHHPGADPARAAARLRHHAAQRAALDGRHGRPPPPASTRTPADPPTVRLRLPLAGSAPRTGRHRRSGPPRPFPVPAQSTTSAASAPLPPLRGRCGRSEGRERVDRARGPRCARTLGTW